MEGRKTRARAFVHRGGGVRIAGTVIACDASAGTELVFLSHAPVFGVHPRRPLPRGGGVRRQVLATEVTLALLGAPGERLKAHALPGAYGRPFGLGDLRLEMFPSGFMPGAASLLCERDGRRIVYAGPIGTIDSGGDRVGAPTCPLPNPPAMVRGEPSSPAPHAPAEVRAADALCIDATFAAPALTFPARAQALADVGRAVRDVLARGEAPVVVIDPLAIALDIGAALAADRIGLCAHRAIVQAAAAYRGAGLPAPALQRFAAKIGPGDALLWPASVRVPPRRAGARAPGIILVSADAGSAPSGEGGGGASDGARARIVFPTAADLAGVVRYVEASGASEVALINAPGDDLAGALRARGIDAYTLGPPRQIELFAA